MTEQQTRPLADIVAEAQGRQPLEFQAIRLNPHENVERDTLHFQWFITLSKKYPGGIASINGEWSCGSAVPLLDLGLAATNTPQQREAIRSAYAPSMVQMIESLLLDYSSASEHVDGWDWAEDCGYGDGSSMADIRKMVEAHPQVMRHGRFLADWFGDLMEAAEQAAIEG